MFRRAIIADHSLSSNNRDGTADMDDEVSTGDSVDAGGSNEINRGFRFVVRGLRIVNPKRDRRDGNYTNPKNNNRPMQALHGVNPKLPGTYACRPTLPI